MQEDCFIPFTLILGRLWQLSGMRLGHVGGNFFLNFVAMPTPIESKYWLKLKKSRRHKAMCVGL